VDSTKRLVDVPNESGGGYRAALLASAVAIPGLPPANPNGTIVCASSIVLMVGRGIGPITNTAPVWERGSIDAGDTQ
jgi:hypothetical protein